MPLKWRLLISGGRVRSDQIFMLNYPYMNLLMHLKCWKTGKLSARWFYRWVDPFGSILGGGNEVYPYKVEGIGYDFFPNVLDNTLIDEYIKINDKNSFNMARKIIKEEGLLVGGSSGGAVWAAMKAAENLNVGDNCLVILPDSIRNYLSKFVDDKWMKNNNF